MATSTKVRIKKIELANSTISTTYGRFKFDANGTARVPIELARELINSGAGFVAVDDNGNEIELPDEGDETLPGGDETIPGGGDDTIQPEPTIPGGGDDTITPEPTIPSGDDTLQPEPTIPGGDDTIEPQPTVQPVYTMPGGTYTTIDGGYVLNAGDDVSYTIIGSELDTEHILIKDGKLEFTQGVDVESVHVKGVEENSTIKIGDTEYKWENSDENLENGLELVSISGGDDTVEPEPTIPGGGDDTIEPEPTIPGGDDTIQPEPTIPGGDETIPGGGDDTITPEPTLPGGDETIPGGGDDTLEPEPTIPSGDDTITPEPTIPGGDDTITPEPITLSGGGTYTTIDGGYVLNDGNSQYTLMGDTLDTEHIAVVNGDVKFSEGINPASIHIMGVAKDSTIEIGNSVFKFDNTDNISGNGLELVLVHDGTTIQPEPTIPGGDTLQPEPTIPGGDDTVEPEPTIPGDDTLPTGVSGFSYDFDGKSFTVSGGLVDDLTVDDLNEKATFDGEKLSLEDGIVSDLNSVHVQGLAENSTVNVEGEVFTLQDADNNPENGLELVGKTSDVYGWVFTNRSTANYESQIWKHTTDGVEDIVVVGCIARPSINNNTLTILGDNIKVISNNARDNITIDSEHIKGLLTKGVSWDSELGIKSGLGTKSYILANNTFYVPKAYVTNVTSPTIEYTLSKGTLTITNGTIDVSQAIVKGSTISSIKYQNKVYSTNVKTGKLVANAWQKRK